MPAGEWTPHEQALEAIARHLGFAQLWRGVRAPIERAIHRAIRDGVVDENGESQELRRPGA